MHLKPSEFAAACITLVVFAGILVALMVNCHYRTKRILEIDYCWDYEGNHYLAPNPLCTH